jgi:hypothetical protein
MKRGKFLRYYEFFTRGALFFRIKPPTFEDVWGRIAMRLELIFLLCWFTAHFGKAGGTALVSRNR